LSQEGGKKEESHNQRGDSWGPRPVKITPLDREPETTGKKRSQEGTGKKGSASGNKRRGYWLARRRHKKIKMTRGKNKKLTKGRCHSRENIQLKFLKREGLDGKRKKSWNGGVRKRRKNSKGQEKSPVKQACGREANVGEINSKKR